MQVILAFCCKVASDTCICICEFIKEQRVEANQNVFDLYAPSQCMLFLYMGSVHVFNFSICYHIAHNDFHLWHLQWPGSIRNKQSDVLLWEAVIGHACDGEREKTFDHGALCVHRGSVCMS